MNDILLKKFKDLPIDFIDGDRGVNYPKKSDFYSEGFCLFLNTGNVTSSGFNFNEINFITQERDELLRKGKLQRKDIVLTTRGTVGNTGFFKNDIPFKEIRINSGMVILRTSEKSLSELYLYHFLKSKIFKNQIQRIASGSAQPQLPIKSLIEVSIPFPKLQTQKQIAKVLSDLDAKIELNNKINAELEAMAKLIYDYWFVQFDFPFDFAQGKPNENGKPYKSSGGKMVYNEALKREIPEGWEVKELTDEMDLQYGFPFSTKLFNSEKKGIPVIRIRDILNCTVSNYSTEEVNDKYKLNKGDILVGMDGNFHINYWNKEDCYLNQRCLRIRSNEDSISEIQTKFLIEPYIKAREKNVSRTTVAHLSARDINDLKVLKATAELQSKANELFNSTLKEIISNSNQNQELSALRNWLLPMLMNGQISITNE